MLLIPGTSHIITWQKQNLLDTQTYYVRAVIRNVRTNTTLDTLNLTDLGSSMRFSKEWLVPQDPSGFGTEISIVKTVYEDSAYTQVSGIYGAWEDRYLIYQLKNPSNNGGGGAGIDYRFIRELIDKKFEEFLNKLPEPDYTEINGYIERDRERIKKQINSVIIENKTAQDELKKIGQEAIKKIGSMINDAQKTISKSTINAGNMIQKVAQDSVQLMTEHRQNSENSLMESTEKQLDMLVSKFDEIGKAKIDNINEKIAKGIDEALSVPLKLQTQEVKIVRDNQKQTSGEDYNAQRAKKLLNGYV